MLSEALRYPLRGRDGRDALAVCVGLVLAGLLLLRLAGALWPAWPAVVVAPLALCPLTLFAGYLGAVLRVAAGGRAADADDAPAFPWSTATARTGLRLLAVAGGYLLPPGVVVVVVVLVLLELGATGGPLLALAPTVALLSLLVSGYLLPGALATAARDGVRSALSRDAFGGLGSGAYFVAWTAALTLLATAWSVLGVARESTPLALLAAVWFTYAHVVAARLAAEGLARSGWRAR
jgi:hypothetical protein